MDANDQSQLEESLRKLSWWTGPEPKLWRKALARSGSSRRAGTGRWGRIARSRWTWFGVPIAAVVVAGVSVGPWGRAPDRAACSAKLRDAVFSAGVSEKESRGDWAFSSDVNGDGKAERYFEGESETMGVELKKRFTSPSAGGTAGQAVDIGLGRQVIRKGSLDLQAEDVRAVYLKVQMIPSEAEGEYVEQSEVSGSGSDVRGYVTLRVRAERVNVVLNSLRSLATVSREQVEASDVTAQAVDLEARLRNEQRVEKELLELLEKRKDSPLADVLKLSESLAAVRERIERLVAQQQQLGRQVALAALLVTINPKDKVVAEAGLGQKLNHSMSSAWADGAAFLISTVGGMVRVVIGGAVWWVLLFAGVWVARRRYLRYADREKTAG